MVDVGGKPKERRRAVAAGRVAMRPETAAMLRSLPKGDALATAQLAGIMAAKRTAELIPLCHPLPLTRIDVELEIAETGVEILATVETTAQLPRALALPASNSASLITPCALRSARRWISSAALPELPAACWMYAFAAASWAAAACCACSAIL